MNTFKTICRFREIHVVNEYGVFQAVYALVGKKAKDMWSEYDWFGQVRPFLTEKIRNRLQFHGCCFHNLHRSLGKPVLPSEYGGDQVAIVKIDNSTTGTSRDVGTLRYVKWLVLSYVHRVELHTVAWVLLSCVTCVELRLSLLSLHWYHSTIVLMIVILNDCFNTVAYGWMKKKNENITSSCQSWHICWQPVCLLQVADEGDDQEELEEALASLSDYCSLLHQLFV